MGLGDLRRSYDGTPLDRDDLDPDPLVQAALWVAEARDALDGETEVNAMALATADEQGRPSVRMVLLKDLDPRGLTFFTNLGSRKAHELRHNPQAAVCLNWLPLYRQIRVVGRCEEIHRAESEAYFATRPLGSRHGAWASHQSSRSRIARRSRPGWPGPRSSSAMTFRCRRTGAGTAWCPTRSSCGRAVPTACTTGSPTTAATRAGSWSGSSRRPDLGASDRRCTAL